MSQVRKLGFDRAALDKVVKEDDAQLTMSAIIASEIVHPYPQGVAYKPGDELEKAAWTAEGRWVTIMKHPDTGLLQNRGDIKGRVTEPKFCKDLMDAKTKRPSRKGIKANITWDKDKVPAEVIDGIKRGELHDVSIGFSYEEDKTPGEWEGQKYDFVQRNICIDHVAAPVPAGRCPSPMCGIGVDSMLDKAHIAGDPWEEGEEYIRSGHRNPDDFDKASLRTITITEGIKAVVGCPKGKYENGKCTVGTEVQSYLFEKSKFNMAEAKAWFEKHPSGDIMKVLDQIAEEIGASKASDMSLKEIEAKIEALTEERDRTWAALSAKWKPKEPDPETAKLDRRWQELGEEIQAYRQAKVNAIVKQASGDCVICAEVEKIGLLEASKRLAIAFGEDVLKVLKGEDLKPPVPADVVSEARRERERLRILLSS